MWKPFILPLSSPFPYREECNNYVSVFLGAFLTDSPQKFVTPSVRQDPRSTPPRDHAFPDAGRRFTDTESGFQVSDRRKDDLGLRFDLLSPHLAGEWCGNQGGVAFIYYI